MRCEQWCKWQLGATDIPDGWACGAHLAEGRCGECRRTAAELYTFPGGRVAPAKDGAKYKGVCEDYEPVE